MAIGIGVMIALGYDGMINGIEKELIENFVDMQTGHIQIHASGYVRRQQIMPLDLSIDEVDELDEELKGIPEIEAVGPRVRFGTMFSLDREGGEEEEPETIIGIGVKPSAEKVISPLIEVSQGGYWSEGEEGMLIGEKLANKIGAEIGDTVVLIAPTVYESINAIRLPIVGFYNIEATEFEKNMIFIPFSQAQELVGFENQASEIAIRLKDETQTEAVADRLREDFKEQALPLEVHTWLDLGTVIKQYLAMGRPIVRGISGLILLLAAAGIVNTMIMAVYERTQEIGMLSAMGVKGRQIISLFIWEGAILGLIGSAIGCSVGTGMILYLQAHGVPLEELWSYFGGAKDMLPEETWNAFPLEMITAAFSWNSLIIIFLFGVIISILATLYPAYMASKLRPVEALRDVG